MRFLLVDSNTTHSQHWRELFAELDVALRITSSSQEALSMLAAESMSAAIVAWEDFPEAFQDGEHLLQQLQAKCRYVACLVERSSAVDSDNAYAAGFDDCFFVDSCLPEVRTKVVRFQEIEQLHQRLAAAQKLESIGELAAGIAHEINTPIQYVGDNTRFVKSAYEDLAEVLERCQDVVTTMDEGGSPLLESAKKLQAAMDDADVEYLQDEVPSAITQTLEGIDRVTNIVRAMKEFAHPGVSEMTNTDLSKSIENTVMVARNEWKYVADLETDFDPDLPNVPCLPGELNQVLLNMIVNAAHAIGESLGESPERKGTLRISTHLATPYAEIRIADSGCGISQENMDKIFTPFFTTKAAGKGTGQGLAIVHSVIVEKHSGTVEVQSTLGEGTTFVIRLPLSRRTSDVSEAELCTT